MAEPPIREQYNGAAGQNWVHDDIAMGGKMAWSMAKDGVSGVGEWAKKPENEGIVKWGAFVIAMMLGLRAGNSIAARMGLSKIPIIGGLLSTGVALLVALGIGTLGGDAAQVAARAARDDPPDSQNTQGDANRAEQLALLEERAAKENLSEGLSGEFAEKATGEADEVVDDEPDKTVSDGPDKVKPDLGPRLGV